MKQLHPPRGWMARFLARLVRFLRRLVAGAPALPPPAPLRTIRPSDYPASRSTRRVRRPPPPCRHSPEQIKSLGGEVTKITPPPAHITAAYFGLGESEPPRPPGRESLRETVKMGQIPESIRALASSLLKEHKERTGEIPVGVVVEESGTSSPVLPHDLAPKTLIVSREEMERQLRERTQHSPSAKVEISPQYEELFSADDAEL